MRTCPHCGSTVGIAATKCWKCGSPLTEGATPSAARGRGSRGRVPALAGVMLIVASILSLLWNVAILATFGVLLFGLTEIIVVALGFVGGFLSIARVKYAVTMPLCSVAVLFLALRAAVHFDAIYSPLLWAGFVLGLVALTLVTGNKRRYG